MSVNPVKTLVLLIIRIYQYAISPLMGRHCRFYPSCSAYAKEAIEVRGLLGGGVLTIKRLLRCHPWHPGGYDPVPGCLADAQDAASDQESRSPLSACCCDTTTTPLTNSPGQCGSDYSVVDKTTTSLKAQNQTDSMAR